MNKRGLGQRIAFLVALLSYSGAVISLISFFFYRAELGGGSPIVASLGSTTVFFIGVGIVLHVIGRVDLPNLSLRAGESVDDKKL